MIITRSRINADFNSETYWGGSGRNNGTQAGIMELIRPSLMNLDHLESEHALNLSYDTILHCKLIFWVQVGLIRQTKLSAVCLCLPLLTDCPCHQLMIVKQTRVRSISGIQRPLTHPTRAVSSFQWLSCYCPPFHCRVPVTADSIHQQ